MTSGLLRLRVELSSRVQPGWCNNVGFMSAYVAPKLIESSKWTNGVWLKGDLPIIYIHTAPDHVQFGFFAGASFTDHKNLLRGKGKHVRHIRVEIIEDIDEATFATMTRKAVKAPAYR